MTYSQNIARLKESGRRELAQSTGQRTAMAARRGQTGIEEAKDVASKLSDFSETLGEWKEQDIKQKTEEGVQAARKARLDKAKKLSGYAKKVQEIEAAKAELRILEEFDSVKAQDTAFHQMKADMLDLGGESAYPDADRIAGLSPWQQVGYAKEKLRMFNDSFDDKLENTMQNSDKAITIQGHTFTAKELRENNIQALPFKEAAVQVMTEDIRKAAGLDRFSPEMLKIAGTEEAVQKSVDGQMAKYRERYNIDSSMNTRAIAQQEWNNSEKTGDDLHRLILINSATVDKNNKILGNSGGLDQAFSILKQEGIRDGTTAKADHYGSLELPEALRKKLGAKPGTTFEQQWPGRFSKLRSDIKAGYASAVEAELKFQKADGKKLEAGFIQAGKNAAKEGRTLTTKEVNDWKNKFSDAGVPIPNGVTKYETVSMRNEREDTDRIKAIIAANRGRITHEQLNEFHPLAAQPFRDKADKFEGQVWKDFGTDKLIAAGLNEVIDNMGLKGHEKSLIYEEALKNAKIDYLEKYNRYKGMGHSDSLANYWALHGTPGQAVDAEGKALPGEFGVLHEIRTNGAGNKYTVIGQNVEKTLDPGNYRVARIASAKREIDQSDGAAIYTGTFGGDYGAKQLTTIMNNIEKHGYKGIYMDKGALQYYQGIAEGYNLKQTGGWWGILDAQLKANGHPGLNEAGKRPDAVNLFKGTDDNDQPLPDPLGENTVNRNIAQSIQYPSYYTNLYTMNTLYDNSNHGGKSRFDLPQNQQPWIKRRTA